jgi:hypothetical protein
MATGFEPKTFRDTLAFELRLRLRPVVDLLVAKAMSGDPASAKEIGDRLENIYGRA